MSALQERVLVLNKGWQPISTTSVRHALTLVYQETARFLDPKSYVTFDFETWKEAAAFAKDSEKVIHGCNFKLLVPEVIILLHYGGFRRRGVRLSRRNIFLRDDYQCQYCGRRLPSQDLTLDHVLPRSRGGRMEWENIVLACRPCNLQKRDRTPSEAGFTLLNMPRRPKWHELRAGRPPGELPASWEAFLSDLYWEQELKSS